MGVYRTRGQTHALGLVQRAVESGRPPHAVLLVGPARVGKTTLALDLACGLLCLAESVADRPCRACAACRKLEHGNHPDLHVVSPEGAGQQIKVGQVQALGSDLALLPLEGRYRIGIIESANRLNPDAQNALLKTLEEPPPRVVLMLCADDTASMLPTVVSRCARIRLAPVDPEVVGAMVAEAGLADRAQGAALGRIAGGRPGIALALAGQPEAVLAQARLARTLLDLLGADRRTRLATQAGLLEDGAILAAAVGGQAPAAERPTARTTERSSRRASPAERRAATAQVLAVWLDVARDLAVAARGGRRELRNVGLLDDLTGVAATVRPAEAATFLARIEAASRALDAYANPELALDALLLAWPHSERAA